MHQVPLKLPEQDLEDVARCFGPASTTMAPPLKFSNW